MEFLPEAVGLCADTFGGRVHVEWDPSAAATPLGQLPFFIEFLKLDGLFDALVADCPLALSSPNAPSKRDILGTLLLAVLAGHQRYAHITALRGDAVNAALLGMRRVMSEDSVRRALAKIDAASGVEWLQRHLDYTFRPLLGEPWILDVDTTIKPLYGRQEGAVVGYNPHKPGRPSHTYHTYAIAELRLMLEVEVQAGNQHASKHSAPGLWALLARIGRAAWPRLVRGDCDWGTEANMSRAEREDLSYLFKLRLTRNAKRLIERAMVEPGWLDAGQGLARQAVELAAGGVEPTPAGDPAATADRTDGGDGDRRRLGPATRPVFRRDHCRSGGQGVRVRGSGDVLARRGSDDSPALSRPGGRREQFR
ncbi:MAG: transposase [Betaproteobacteria bacterium]